MNIYLTIEKDKILWEATLSKLHLLGFKWHRTGRSLNEFHFIDGMLRLGPKVLVLISKTKQLLGLLNHLNTITILLK